VDPALPSRLPFEMFYGIRDVNVFPIDAGFLQCSVENFSRRSDKRTALNVLLISGLLADEHHARFRTAAFPENCLGSSCPEITSAATRGGIAEF
jgi:hypothetical protein